MAWPTTASNCLSASRQDGQDARCSCSLLCSASLSCPEVETAQSSKNSSWGSVRDNAPAPSFYASFHHSARWLSMALQLAIKDVLPQFFQPSEIVMSNISFGLP